MANAFTPEQIAQILEEFFKTVGTRQYIGARYVPIFGRKDEESIEWDNTKPYEPLTIVLYLGNSYTSRQYVPAGVQITDEEFWAITGNYNAQIEQYRRETARALQAAQGAQGDIDALLPKTAFSSENTVKKYVDDTVGNVQNDIDTLLPNTAFSSENTVKKYVDDSIAVSAVKGSINGYHDLTYFGRIVPMAHYNQRFGQGMCLLNDSDALCTCTSVDNALAYIYKVNIESGTVVSVLQSEIGHANDLYYDSHSDRVLVAPNQIAGADVTEVLECSPANMQIMSRHDVGFRPTSIFRYDDQLYICAIASGVVDIYKCSDDFTNIDAFMNLPALDTGNRSVPQMVRMRNDNIYVLYGGNNNQAIYIYDLNGTIVGRIGFGKSLEYFDITEYESFDFDSNGDIILYANSGIAGVYNMYCNIICGINISGKLTTPNDIVSNNALITNLRINYNGDYNARIRPTGSNTLQFPSIEEALAMCIASNGGNLFLETDAYWCTNSSIFNQTNTEVYINGNGHHIYAGAPYAGTPFAKCEFIGGNLYINNAKIASSPQVNNVNLRPSQCTFSMVGGSVDYANSTTVAPLRFDHCVVMLDSDIVAEGEGTHFALLMGKSLLVTSNENFVYSGQIAKVP